MKNVLAILFLFTGATWAQAQPEIPINGPQHKLPAYVAITHARVYTDASTITEDATLIIKEGRIVSVIAHGTVPEGAREIRYDNKTIYPGFIDLYSDYGMVYKPERKESAPEHQISSSKPGAFSWNEAVHPETEAKAFFRYDESKAKALREAGFAAVLTGLHDGIFRGSAALVHTAQGREQELMIESQVAAGCSFSKGTSTQPYPSSLAGVIALIRQTYYDQQWYVTQHDEKNLSLDALTIQLRMPTIFAVDNKLDVMRAAAIGEEFGLTYIVKGNGDEYQRADAIRSRKLRMIIPLNFPRPYDVDDPMETSRISTSDLKHWELAPYNASYLEQSGIVFAFTSKGTEHPADFIKNLRKAVACGLSEKTALAALTSVPATIIGMNDRIGALKAGMFANFVVTDGNVFDKQSSLLECWSMGQQYVLQASASNDITGEYELTGIDRTTMKINGSKLKLSATLIGKDTLKGNLTGNQGIYHIQFAGKGKFMTMSLWISEEDSSRFPPGARLLEGKYSDSLHADAMFSARYIKAVQPDSVKKDAQKKYVPGHITYPFTDYGWTQKPVQESILFKDATVWTNETAGNLEHTDVYIENGKIVKIGKNLQITAKRTIDARGAHLTNGIIDEHSHIALTRGVNEGTQAVTAEVRMGDVINSEDINIYRQLSGGVTTSQLLHGSANPIGGQSGLIKLRWGLTPDEMKVAGADGFIKFALGENVKQSNWGDRATFRYPQTRMGVEQVYMDAFTRAHEYQQRKGRKDLELETLTEILNGKRFITCHSYVQSEINMLMHVADSFHFKVNTFTHILEGYKVADKMKAHGVGASTFADWWAYKYEVMEAIPYNAALLNQMGVVTAINSDDAEMGRRLNQEAAKTVKYGGVSEQDAWKMVTLNPAKLLHLDQRTGSIREGKDADLVLWTDHPLSIYAKVKYTFVDGVCYFDHEKDKLMQLSIKNERNRIIQRMLAEKAEGEKTEKKVSVLFDEYHCETGGDYGN